MARLPRLPASLWFLFTAIFLYALFGSPTPDHPGWVEISIGVLLLVAVGAGGLSDSVNLHRDRTRFLRILQILFLWGLIVPTLSGVWQANPAGVIFRDLAAFAFLALPLFFARRIAATANGERIFAGLLFFAGLVFALRTLVPVLNIWVPRGELIYLSNSPLAMFAALFATGTIWNALLERRPGWIINLVLPCLALGVLVAAMLLDVQRATIGAIAASALMLATASFADRPHRTFVAALVLAVILLGAWPWITQIGEAIIHKTAEVGLNARAAEARAVMSEIFSGPWQIMFGKGWGASFASPAVAGLTVNYTHSLLTTMLLKGGLPMLLLSTALLVAATQEIIAIWREDRGRAQALVWPLMIPALLYASHKSFDFGLILLLIAVWSIRAAPLPTAPSSDKT